MEDITKQQIKDIISEHLDDYANKNMFQVSPIPAHAHTGVESQKIDIRSIDNANLYYAVNTINITSAQIKLLNTTPVPLVNAFGVNSFIIVEGISAKNYFTGTAYTGANNLEFRYTDGSGINVTADMANTFINLAVNGVRHVAGITTDFVPVVNASIVVRVPTANPATGTGNITFVIKYRVIIL